MKKLVLLLAVFFICLSLSAQKITKEFLSGEWESETVILNFKVESKNDLYISAYSIVTDNYFKTIGYQFNKNAFYLEMLHEPNNWGSIAKFIIVDKNTMIADYVCDAPGQLIYKRKLNN
jgi:multisubunit Na+/H+ antiporter MnhE subunit